MDGRDLVGERRGARGSELDLEVLAQVAGVNSPIDDALRAMSNARCPQPEAR